MLKRIQDEIKLVLRDIYYNKICASVLLPNTIRTLLYKAGGGYILKIKLQYAHTVLLVVDN